MGRDIVKIKKAAKNRLISCTNADKICYNENMDYVYLALAVVCVGFQFVTTKLFRMKAGMSILSSIIFNLVSGGVSALLLLAVNGFNVSVKPFSVIMGVLFAVSMVTINCVCIFAMSAGKVSVYSLFMMLGGMLLPFGYGAIFLNETVSVYRWIALVLMIGAMVLPCVSDRKRKNSKRFYIFCALGFILNGALSIVSKCHQHYTKLDPSLGSSTGSFAVTAYSFVFYISAVLISVYAAVTAIMKKVKSKKAAESAAAELHNPDTNEELTVEVAATNTAVESVAEEKSGDMKKRLCFAALFCSLYGLISATGNFLQLLGARNLPAVLQYPVVTGGSIILSALFGLLFFKEKIDKFNIISIVLAFAATVLFLF